MRHKRVFQNFAKLNKVFFFFFIEPIVKKFVSVLNFLDLKNIWKHTLPTSYFLLPTAYFLLPTSYFLLSTSYFLLPTSAVRMYNFPTHKGFCHNFPTK